MQEVQLYIEGQKVDLFQDETISLTSTIQNVRDISKVFTDFSQQFNLPATKTNNKIFKHYYNYDITNTFDARYKITSLIKINGADFKKGYIRLNSVSLKDNAPNSYKIVFFGETVRIGDVLGNDELSSLDLSEYDHAYNQSTVLAGLTTGLTTGGTISATRDIVYPLISHTRKFIYNTANGFHNPLTGQGVLYNDLKPAIKIKHIIKAIENKYTIANGYSNNIKFSNDYFISEEFNNMYLWLHKEKGNIGTGTNEQSKIISLSSWIYQGTEVNAISPTPLTVFKSTNIRYRTYEFTYTITPVETGTYSIIMKNTTGGSVVATKTNVTGVQTLTYLFQANLGTSYEIAPELTVKTKGGITNFTPTLVVNRVFKSNAVDEISTDDTGNYALATGSLSVVSEIFISNVIPKMKTLDFLTNIFKLSNLTAYLKDDEIIVDTLDNFYFNGIDYDITKYVSIENSSVDRALPYSKINFKYSPPVTYFTIKSNEIGNFEFGNLEFDDDSKFDGGAYDINIGFEHSVYERMSNQDTSDVTQIQWGWFVDSKEEPTLGAPLIFYNQNRICDTTQVKFAGSGINTYNSPSNVLENQLQTLNFGAETDEYLGTINENSLFLSYYYNYILSVFNPKARLLKIKSFLPLSILLKYKLSDRFVINGKKYKINSVQTNLQTGENELELITNTDYISFKQAYDTIPPTVPINLIITNITQTSFLFSWSASTDISGILKYEVYRNNVFLGSTSNTNFSVTGLSPSTTYTMKVRAVDNANNISAFSNNINGTTTGSQVEDTTPPSDVLNLSTGLITYNSIDLTWNAATDNIGVAGYYIYNSAGSLLFNAGNSTIFTVTGLTASTTYSYKVKAYDSAGNLSTNFSNTITPSTVAIPSDTTPPSDVTGLTASLITNTSLRLTWNAATDNVGISGYKIYNSAGSLLFDVGNVLLKDVTGLGEYTPHTYKVKAYDAAGNHSVNFSNTVSVTTLDITPPTIPTGLTITNRLQTSFLFSWNASTDDSGILEYQVYRNNVFIGSTANTFFNVTGLIQGVTYTMKVRAVDNNNNISDFSVNINGTTAAAPLFANFLLVDSTANQAVIAGAEGVLWTNQLDCILTDRLISFNDLQGKYRCTANSNVGTINVGEFGIERATVNCYRVREGVTSTKYAVASNFRILYNVAGTSFNFAIPSALLPQLDGDLYFLEFDNLI